MSMKKIKLVMDKSYNRIIKYAGLLTKEESLNIKKEVYNERKLPSRRFN